MNFTIEAVKDESAQRSIPTAWRVTIAAIVHGLIVDDLSTGSIPDVCPVPSEQRARIAGNISQYGAHPVELPEQSWDTSVCHWMGGYWEALIDLFTEEEGRSDLALSLRVTENRGGYLFEVMSVHVP